VRTDIMDLQQYLSEAEGLERDGSAALQNAADSETLEAARIAYLGDRQGRVKGLQEALRGVAKEDKPAAGKRFNEVRTRLEALHAERKQSLDRARGANDGEDLTLPARGRWR